jgi:hypothetical protein
MGKLSWQKIVLSVLILAALLMVSSCQSNLVNGIEDSIKALSHVPDQLTGVISGILSGLRNIGGALADSIGNMVGNMMGR